LTNWRTSVFDIICLLDEGFS